MQHSLQKLEQDRADIETNKVYEGAFKWRFEFPEVLDEAGNYLGFDVVIGNPPYIRIQDLQIASSISELYKTNFSVGKKGNYDIYVLFIESGLMILNDKSGVLNFILPHKFMNSNYAEATRNLISDGKFLSQIVHFGHQQIFDEATTYTCLLLLDKIRSETFEYISVDGIDNWKLKEDEPVKMDTNIFEGQEWHLLNKQDLKLYQKLKQNQFTLADTTERIYQGLKTSADKIYIVEEVRTLKDLIIIYSPFLEKEVEVESNLFHILIKGGDSKPYKILPTKRQILFPYQSSKLILPEELEQKFPKTWKYLQSCEQYLRNRENGKMNINGWYGYVYPKALDVINKPKIFTPDIAAKPSFSLDITGEMYFTGGASGGYGIIPNEQYDFKFLLSILNSKISSWYISKTSTQMRGGYYSFESRFIKNLPIAQADEETKAGIRALVEQILAAKQADAGADTSALEAEIDLQVYRLYNLTYDEVLLVEPGFAIPRAAYEMQDVISAKL